MVLNFCPFCGAKILNQDVRFCMNCGKSLEAFMGVPVAAAPELRIPESKLPTVAPKKSAPKSNNNASIEHELQKCRESAEEGYKLATDNYNEIKNVLKEEKKRLSSTSAEQVQFSRIKSTELVDKQKTELRHLTDSVTLIEKDLDALRERQKDFSIVVYGRTMAGKSTLMEILTRGNGDSIGKGGQRTTLDVRDYYWQGLKITDVPGISAFGGKKDEELAMKAAKAADLILFLLTDDAPQADEAEKLAQLKKLGKPILGLINIKMSFNLSRRAIALRQLQKKLADTDTINNILNQFKAYDKSYDQDWSGITFVATHLLAAYQAHPCRADDAEVFAASNFAEVESFILDKVRRDGRFLRIKTFADSIAVPMNNIILAIYNHSGNALLESNIWFAKRVELLTWREDFLKRSQTKLDNLYKELSDTLNNEISRFADRHYEDERINQTWPAHVKGLGFDTRYQDLLQEFATACEHKRKSLSDELRQEMKYTFSSNTSTNIALEGTTAWGEYGSALIGGIGGVGGFLASRAIGIAFPPLGIALAAVSLLGWIFSDSKEEKIRKAKAKLREDLKPPSFKMLDNMHSQIIDIFNKDILGKGIDEFSGLLGDYAHMLARLGQSQTVMANTLAKEFGDLNAKLLGEAISYKGAGVISSVNEIARVPGKAMVAFAGRSNVNTKELSTLMEEEIVIDKPSENISDTLIKVLHCDFEIDEYPLDYDTDEKEAERAIAVFPKNKIDATSFKLAQQIAGVPIITDIPTKSTKVNSAKSEPVITSSPVLTFTDFKAEFRIVDKMLDDNVHSRIIKDKLSEIEIKANNLRNADAMIKLSDYWRKVGQDNQAARCFNRAQKF